MNGGKKPKAVAEAEQELHPAGGVRYGGIRQFIRMCSFAAYFLGCCTVYILNTLLSTLYARTQRPLLVALIFESYVLIFIFNLEYMSPKYDYFNSPTLTHIV